MSCCQICFQVSRKKKIVFKFEGKASAPIAKVLDVIEVSRDGLMDGWMDGEAVGR